MEPPFILKRPKVKPVHLATGVFVARQGGFLQLKLLNKVVMHQPKVQKSGPYKGRVNPNDPYTSEKLFEELRVAESLSERMSRAQLETVRRALHQFVANDQAAFHCYAPHRPFGNDYSVCDKRLVTMDPAHPTDGGLGNVLVNLLGNSDSGRSVLTSIDTLLAQPSAIGDLSSPFLESEEMVSRPLTPIDVDELTRVTGVQTEALANLVSRLRGNFTPETQSRLLIIGLSLWIITTLLRWSERACGTTSQRLLLADFTQRPRRPLRKASWLSVIQARRQLGDYKAQCKNANPPVSDPGNWSEMFDYLGKRCGLIQPRSDSSRGRKYIEPMPDTIRVVVMSCFKPNETLLPFVQLAKRIRETWGIVIGAEPDDTARIREAGFGNLQEDDDIAANVAAFRERLEELQLAARLSDGEHRCAALPEDLP